VAIGWGKSFEDQVEEGNQRLSEKEPHVRLDHQARLRLQRLESLKLSRSRILAQLDRATNDSHRKVLMNGLRAIEKQMETVSADEASNSNQSG
jgi:sigma54-dependent transcription regulator